MGLSDPDPEKDNFQKHCEKKRKKILKMFNDYIVDKLP